MSAYRRYVRVASIVVGIVSPAAAAPQLAAQGGGGGQARRPVATTSSEASARSMLRHLVGRWRVEIRFAGNFDGPPDASGTRVVAALYDDLRLQWTEQLDSSRTRSQGLLGFDPRSGRFYSTTVDSAGSGAEFLTGTLSPREPLVTFIPIADRPPPLPLPLPFLRVESAGDGIVQLDHGGRRPLHLGTTRSRVARGADARAVANLRPGHRLTPG